MTHNTNKLLAGTDWRLLRHEEAEHVNEVYERTHRAGIARNEGEANMQMTATSGPADMYTFSTEKHAAFKPPFARHEEVEPEAFTPARVLIGCGVFLAVCVAVAVAALNYFR